MYTREGFLGIFAGAVVARGRPSIDLLSGATLFTVERPA